MTKVIFRANIGPPIVIRVAAIRVDVMFDQVVKSGLRHPAVEDAIDLIAGSAFGAILASMVCDLIIAMLVLAAIHLLRRACTRAGSGRAHRRPGDPARIAVRTDGNSMPHVAATLV